MGEQFWDNNYGENYRINCWECEGEPGSNLLRRIDPPPPPPPSDGNGRGGNNGAAAFGGARRRDSNNSDASDVGIFMQPPT